MILELHVSYMVSDTLLFEWRAGAKFCRERRLHITLTPLENATHVLLV
jgi:hypothetical protein